MHASKGKVTLWNRKPVHKEPNHRPYLIAVELYNEIEVMQATNPFTEWGIVNQTLFTR